MFISFDPEIVSYDQLLEIFFKVIHDPTQLNRQGPDVGTQYRSAIFFVDDWQKKAAETYIGKLGEGKAFKDPIVTQVVPLEKFYDAESYHQDYLRKNPKDPVHRLSRPAKTGGSEEAVSCFIRQEINSETNHYPLVTIHCKKGSIFRIFSLFSGSVVSDKWVV